MQSLSRRKHVLFPRNFAGTYIFATRETYKIIAGARTVYIWKNKMTNTLKAMPLIAKKSSFDQSYMTKAYNFEWHENFHAYWLRNIFRGQIAPRYFQEDCCCCCFFFMHLHEDYSAILWRGDCCATHAPIAEVFTSANSISQNSISRSHFSHRRTHVATRM